MDPPRPSYSSCQCHIQILNLGVMPLEDTIENIDDHGFERIMDALLHSVDKMVTKHADVRMTLTIPLSRALNVDDWVKLVEGLEGHPGIKQGSVKSDYDEKETIQAASKDGLNDLVVKISGANAFFKKIVQKDDSFQVVEDLTQQMKQCEVFAFKTPKRGAGRFRGRTNQPY